MKKTKLDAAIAETKSETKTALLLILDNLNHGQRKKILAVPEVKTLCERYGITE